MNNIYVTIIGEERVNLAAQLQDYHDEHSVWGFLDFLKVLAIQRRTTVKVLE